MNIQGFSNVIDGLTVEYAQVGLANIKPDI